MLIGFSILAWQPKFHTDVDKLKISDFQFSFSYSRVQQFAVFCQKLVLFYMSRLSTERATKKHSAASAFLAFPRFWLARGERHTHCPCHQQLSWFATIFIEFVQSSQLLNFRIYSKTVQDFYQLLVRWNKVLIP